MTFQELKQFISEDMRMSHMYQPVMLLNMSFEINYEN